MLNPAHEKTKDGYKVALEQVNAFVRAWKGVNLFEVLQPSEICFAKDNFG